MNTRRSRSFRASLSLFATTGLLAVSGYAQTAAPAKTTTTAPATGEAQVLEKFEVTGSYIKVSELVGSSPVDVISDRQIRSSGVTDASQLLKKLNVGFQGNGNVSTEVNNGGGGESNIALRNLTTLVLVDGRRMTGSPFSQGTATDLNTIPFGMIERIEVLKDGASTLYGSDAIGGVVNIILKKNYNGAEARVRYGATRHRDYTTKGATIVAGVANDTTSITMGIDWFKNDQLATNSRKVASLSIPELKAAGNSASALPSYFSGSFPGRVGSFVVAGSPIAIGAPGYNAAIKTPPAKTDPNAPGLTLAQQAALGYYVNTTTTPLSIASGGGSTILNTTQFGTASIIPTDRRQLALKAEHKVMGDSLVAFGDVLYADTINLGTVLAPSPLASLASNNLVIPANNPYNLFGTQIPGGAISDPGVRTRLVDGGNRFQTDATQTYRIVGGLKGDINENYSWQADATYSRASLIQNTYGGANGSVMNQLLKPLLNSSGGYTYNSAGRPLSVYQDSNGNNLPVYDYFAIAGFNDPASVNAIKVVLFKSGVTELTQGNLLFRGTPFDLPAGKLAFATGIEYRKEELVSAVDGLFAQGLALGYNPASTFAGGKRSTKSLFAEVEIPVFSSKWEVPGAHVLSINASGRYEDLGSATSRVPRVGIKWQPIDNSITIRGTYAKGFIAPSIFSLFGPAQGNSPTFTLPEGNGLTSSGGATGKTVTGQFTSASELSNPNLQPSESISRTFGVVYSPKEVRGLTFTADYYFIKQSKVGGIDYTSIFKDLNAKGSGSIYAKGFLFTDGSKLTTTAPGQITNTNSGQISVAVDPSGEQYTDGLDYSVDYNLPQTDAYGQVNVGVIANILFNYKFRPNPGSKNNQYARQQTGATYGLGGANGVLPGYVVKPYVNWRFKGFTTQLFVSYTPSVIDAGSLFAGQDVTNAKTADGKAFRVPSYTTADISVGYTFKGKNAWYDGINALVGCNNISNKTAPFIPDGNEDNTDKRTYDIVGRYYFFEVGKKF